jgi:uncharacterized protein YutE (UPF0331/DUF86 family)
LVDRPMVMRKLEALDTHHQKILSYPNTTLAEYEGDWKTQRIVERTLQIMIEICVDIASHIIADSGHRTPTIYADTFQVLNENGVISDGLLANLDKMVKFRNIIVHQYETTDTGIVISILKNTIFHVTRK